jgi:hypothetical protein
LCTTAAQQDKHIQQQQVPSEMTGMSDCSLRKDTLQDAAGRLFTPINVLTVS